MDHARPRLGQVVAHTAVGVLPSLATVLAVDHEPVTDARIALLGASEYDGPVNPLPHAGGEIEDVAALYGDRVVGLAVGRHATRARFWEHTGTSETILHVVCRGTLEWDEPVASGLLFSDAKVDAADLVLRRIAAAAVVLSGSHTGWRPHAVRSMDLADDEATGLTAAMLEAGAQFVLVSVPPAPDRPIRRFMTTWHRYPCGRPVLSHRPPGDTAALHDVSPAAFPGWAGADGVRLPVTVSGACPVPRPGPRPRHRTSPRALPGTAADAPHG